MLTIRGLRKTFGSLVAVDDLSLEVRPGEIVGLLGPNGAGKTTTIHMIAGLLTPDHGLIDLAGLGAPTRPVVRRQLGIAPQALAMYPDLTGEEIVEFFGSIAGLRDVRLRERVRFSLEFVNLSDRRRDRVGTYSGGMKRRLNLAIALVHDPPILLLDEPTAGVDPQSRVAVLENVRTLRNEGRAILYTTHYMGEAQELCDRVGIMDHGKLLIIDTVDGLIARQGGRTLVTAVREEGTIRIETDDFVAEIVRLHQEGGVRRLRVDRPNIESVFLNLTGRQLRD
jgi:ABC-2 type transport system ATP-binding protein